MDGKKGKFDNHVRQGERCPANLLPALEFVKQIPDRLQNSLKSHFKHFAKNEVKIGAANPLTMMGRQSFNAFEVNLDKQLQAWKENPNWVGQSPEITVSVPKGSLCNLKVKFNVGLPPDAIYNIVIDPDNKRVFKNIQEVISRKVLIDEGQRQVVEVEQAALWRFLWWSGTISVHVFVDQNRKDHTVKFKQGKTGFMNKFEGCWKVEPLLVDSCTAGKGRIGSIVTLDQLIEPALVPPPPISWYLRGITTRTTEMLITDLLAEAARLRGDLSSKVLEESLDPACVGRSTYIFDDGIKERWQQRRSMRRQRIHRALV
ncbi:uncharacterized protein A4U43_C05F13460 [Asparagus officinalis]|uniref:DUF220 domain-containing protein n=1 Tax=Asparagus officinalis TaxID=4686 RepID=A0A5P1EVQ7_ASPOF|nr:uncharacterized protein LOC109843363 [Asparagus officinalis]ONK68571.1 uncharacterized protein A4U43_C05F13460 [Asparagus officinalis]